ncbi:MAG: InlB B-repeat-containing protein [Treponema sp.]|nr:InlB B-repeat-containing protein [Treponema sp.]
MKNLFRAVPKLLWAFLTAAFLITFSGCLTDETDNTTEEQFYSIQIDSNIENGSVTANFFSVREGALVTLTALPDKDYQLDSFSGKDAGGNAITVNVSTATEGTFIMPASNVTVSASFKKIQNDSGNQGGNEGEGQEGGSESGEGNDGEGQGGQTGGEGQEGQTGGEGQEGQTGGEGQQGTGGEGQGGSEDSGDDPEGGETPKPKECWIGFNRNQPTDSYTTGSMDSIKSYENEEISLTENAFSVSGYNFKEWNTKRDGSGQSYQNKEKITLTEEMYGQSDWVTLYAIWEPASDTKYIVYHYFEPADGSENLMFYEFDTDKTEELTGTTGGQTQAKALEIPGFTVLDFEQETINAPNPNKSEDERYTRVFIYYKRNAHTISFYANAGEDEIDLPEDISEPINTRFGAKEELLALLEDRPSYNFAGWNTKADGRGSTYTPDAWDYLNITMEDQDLVLYAQWTPITAKLTIETGSKEYTIKDTPAGNINSSKHLLSVNTDLKIPASDFIWEIDGKALSEFADASWLTVGKVGSENEGTISIETYSWKQGSMHHISVKSIVNGRIYSSSISISKPRSTN